MNFEKLQLKYGLIVEAIGKRDYSEKVKKNKLTRKEILDNIKEHVIEPPNVKNIEESIRDQIASLWVIPNKTHNILKSCAEAGISKATTSKEKLAVKGFTFCKRLLTVIDYLKVNQKNIPLDTLRQALSTIVKLIESNRIERDFPAVNEVVYVIHPVSKKYDKKQRDDQLGKVSTGLSRILGISLDMLADLKKMLGYSPVPEAERFEPARAPLAESAIISFIRQYGNQYGISSTEDWRVVFENDPELKEQMTTVINALNRGQNPKDGTLVKEQIVEILNAHRARMKTNEFAVENELDRTQEQTRLQRIKELNNKNFENIKSLDADPKFMEEQKRIEDERKQREIEEDRERLIQKYENEIIKYWMKKGSL